MASNFISRSRLIAIIMFVMIISNAGVIPCTAAGFNHSGILIPKSELFIYTIDYVKIGIV